MIDSYDSHSQTSVGGLRGCVLLAIIPVQTVAPNDSLKQDGSSWKGDILDSLLHSGRKWRPVVHIIHSQWAKLRW